ncbi:MAG: DNA cytosine methyltransferase [Alphaproteobacteria bacterium]|nr:DNA cytosine methyltransferase [Alphaproteobacteria bacterium]QQS58635.1 MAG: DNA cytosine methyltransferase [Alphaproteobacteria bacterium]
MKKRSLKHKPVLLSLFCGAGGLDIGFEKKGFEVGLAFDIRPDSIASYNVNRKLSHAFVQDVNDLTLKEMDRLYGGPFTPVGVIGGPPCQGFSVSNVNKKKSDERNKLSLTYAALLKELNKRSPVHFFVFENVKGLLGEKHRDTYEEIKKSFEECGFNVYTSMLNAVHYGVPQNRERLIIVGLNKKIYVDAEWKPPERIKSKSLPITVKEAIGNLPKPVYFSRKLNPVDIPYHPNHWCMQPKSKKFSLEGVLVEGQSFGRSFRTLRWNKPSPTVAYGNREVHVHPSGTRRLSIYEAMLLQGFSQDYVLTGTLSQQITQVSEAVPPPLSQAIAKSLLSQLRLFEDLKKAS